MSETRRTAYREDARAKSGGESYEQKHSMVHTGMRKGIHRLVDCGGIGESSRDDSLVRNGKTMFQARLDSPIELFVSPFHLHSI
jgi:hypothetical protein